MYSAFLEDRAIISLSGEETIAFLQGLISNDARPLNDNKPVYTALLTPQGKFLHDFFLIPYQGKILIDVKTARATDLLNRLKIYRLRSKVDIVPETEMAVAAIWGEGRIDSINYASENARIYADPRLAELGLRAYGEKNIIESLWQKYSLTNLPEQEYHRLRLALTVPDTADMITEKSLLLECGFEELNGVDFNKGCYVGQEVTARSKFRGQVRKGFYKVEGHGDLPASGSEILCGEKNIGQMRSSAGNTGIAIINNDEYLAALNGELEFSCAGSRVFLALPFWNKNPGKKL